MFNDNYITFINKVNYYIKFSLLLMHTLILINIGHKSPTWCPWKPWRHWILFPETSFRKPAFRRVGFSGKLVSGESDY